MTTTRELELDRLSKVHVTEMGWSVWLREQEGGGYIIEAGGRPIRKKGGKGDVMTYRGLQTALNRFHAEVEAVEGWEAKLKLDGKWHPIRLCAGGCGLEVRVTPRTYPDGHVETVEWIIENEQFWCVPCGSERR